MDNRKAITKPIIHAAIIMMIFSCLLSACSGKNNADEKLSEPSSREEYISQDKESVGYYKHISIAKECNTLEEMKELLNVMKKGYLILNDDGTAFFDLDGEITEYTFDKTYFYLIDDTEKNNGFPYTYIGGRLVVNEGETVTQYFRLTDEEIASYLKSK